VRIAGDITDEQENARQVARGFRDRSLGQRPFATDSNGSSATSSRHPNLTARCWSSRLRGRGSLSYLARGYLRARVRVRTLADHGRSLPRAALAVCERLGVTDAHDLADRLFPHREDYAHGDPPMSAGSGWATLS
jgi:hypothetical protein